MEYSKFNNICDIFISRPSKSINMPLNAYNITPSNLNENNIISNLSKICINLDGDDKHKLRDNDILIKRLNPLFVNIFKSLDMPSYASSNVIVIRAYEGYSPRYIATMFEINGIEKMTHYVKKGVTIQAISTKELSEITIPMLPIKEQNIIGNLWFLQHEKTKLQRKLIENEILYIRATIKTFIKEEK